MTENAESRRAGRFGCLILVPVITFLLIAAAVMAFLLYDRHLRNSGLKQLSAADRADFEYWVVQPINISSADKRQVPSPQLLDAHRRFNDKAEKLDDAAVEALAGGNPSRAEQAIEKGLKPAFQKSTRMKLLVDKISSVEKLHGETLAMMSMQLAPVTGKLSLGQKLGTETLAMMSMQLAPVADLIDDARELASDPAYTPYNHHFDYDASMASDSAELLILTYAMLKAEQQDWTAALTGLQTLVEMLRVPKEMALKSYYALRLSHATMFLAERTSETATLRSILATMNHARKTALHPPRPITMLRPSGVELIREMKELDYIQAYPKTLGEALALLAMQRDYDYYVVDHLPAGDPRHVRSKSRILLSSMSDSRRDVILRRLHVGLIKPAVRRLQLSAKTAHVAGMITADAPRERDITRALTKFDLNRLAIARRIAQLDKKPLPVAEKDIVPEYLDEYPNDLYADGEAPLRWDEARKRHFSVGPDGEADTHDDVTVKPRWF